MEDAPSTCKQNHADIQAQHTARREKEELYKKKEFGKCNRRIHRRIVLSSNVLLPSLLER
jgi:hypothetical protein